MPDPSTSPENEFSYVDKTTGRSIAFTPKRDEAVVTFREPMDADTLNEAVREAPALSISEGFNADLGFAAVHVESTEDTDAAARSREALPEVADSMPVMLDENGSSRYFLPDQVTVQFRPEVDDTRARELINEHGSRVVVAQRTPGYYTVAVPADRDVFETIREFSELAEVAFSEPSEVSFNSALYVPDDPEFGRLWGLHNTGQNVNGTTGTADADIDAPQAWDLVRGHPDVVITVIDTGADMDHDDLQANILARGTEDWDFAAADAVPEDEAGNSHGTHVCGTAAAVDNTTGLIGVAPGCRLMPLRVDLTTGMNQNRADAINYTTTQARAHSERRYVINCSWRMNGDHAGVRTAIQNAVNNNVVVVYAAGNDDVNTDDSPQFPGVYPEVISVAALDQRDSKADFSNFGANVDVAAPGVNIWSTTRNDNRGFLDGTSMAAPHVAGLAALVWSANRHLTNHQVRQIIEDTCDNIDAANPDFVGLLGHGRINARAAVGLALRTEGPAVLRGRYTIQQRSNNRFVDAHEHAGEDFRLVTRTAQNNDTQRWVLTPVGAVYTIQQRSNNRFVDAHEHAGEDFRLVTRTAQNNDTQRWVLTPTAEYLSTYTIQQLSNGRYVDAHEHAGEDFRLVTRTAQHNNTQRWIVSDIGDDVYLIQQSSNNRFVDAHEHAGEDFRLVTRTAQNNDTQRWIVRPIGYVYTIQQLSGGRFVDAHEHAGEDFRLVTRTAQVNDTQKWVAINVGRDSYTLQQLSNGRYVDAHEHAGEDFRLVTRTAQNNDTQRWIIRRV
jgi:subtilisin family serine protease